MNEASAIGSLVLAGTQLLTFIVLWRKINGVTESREIYPQPLEVRPAADPAEREHLHPEYQLASNCTSVQRQIKVDMEEIEKRHSVRTENLRIEIKADVRGIHSRVDDILRAVSALGGRIDEIGKRK